MLLCVGYKSVLTAQRTRDLSIGWLAQEALTGLASSPQLTCLLCSGSHQQLLEAHVLYCGLSKPPARAKLCVWQLLEAHGYSSWSMGRYNITLHDYSSWSMGRYSITLHDYSSWSMGRYSITLHDTA